MDDVLKRLEMFDDPNFKFDPEKHKYTLDGEHLISVTQFISTFHKQFETDYWSKKKAEESGVSQDEILLEWKKLNDRSNEIGTGVHNYFENYYNKNFKFILIINFVVERFLFLSNKCIKISLYNLNICLIRFNLLFNFFKFFILLFILNSLLIFYLILSISI